MCSDQSNTVQPPHQKHITPGVLFVWNCSICENVLGVVRGHGVQIRYKGLIVEAVFPVLRLCHKCKSWNHCSGPEEALTGEIMYDMLSVDTMQTLLPRLIHKVE